MKLYYRVRKQGALVFRMEVSNRQRRIELNQIAAITGKDEIRPHKRRPPTAEEEAEIRAWWADHKTRREAGELDEIETFMEELNKFTNWIEKEAPNAAVGAQSDPLLMALLDLRQVIVRRLSEDLPEAEAAPRPGAARAS
jgi:hypothetical protein